MIGNTIRMLRSLKELSQRDLAKKMGFKRAASVTFLESGKNNPSVNILNELADFFQVSSDFLLGKKDDDLGYLKLLLSFKLKKLVENKNLSIEEISELSGISSTEVLKVQNCITLLDPSDYYKIAKFLKMQDNDIINLMREISLVYSKKNNSIPIIIPVVKNILNLTSIFEESNIAGYVGTTFSGENFYEDNKFFAFRCNEEIATKKYWKNMLLIVERNSKADNGDICIIKNETNKLSIKITTRTEENFIVAVNEDNPQDVNVITHENEELRIIGKIKYVVSDKSSNIPINNIQKYKPLINEF